MSRCVRCVARPAVVAAVTVLIVGAASGAQGPESASLAGQLAAALESAQLDSIAARDPEGPEGADRFVAALRFPGQLMVVSARYEVPVYIEQKLEAGSYRDVYMGGCPERSGKSVVTPARLWYRRGSAERRGHR